MSFIRIAHRGAPKLAPENTIASFKKALEFDIDCIELDVHITKDNEIVVMHDDTLDRTTNIKGALAEKTLSEIRQADAGAWYALKFKGERIPTLREALEFINKRVITVIEIKDDWIGPRVVKLIEKMKLEDYIIIISFHPKVIADIRKTGSTVQTGLLIGSEPSGAKDTRRALDLIHRAAKIGANHLTIYHKMITPEMAYQIRKRGMPLYVWTVDDAKTMASLSDMGISGITSNVPGLFKNFK
ncbi:MAG: hypothetical protein A2044_04495 [Candidatus Firestonebacteria bacterium GWA2_43_8]|nr:MAG: hypothetical protein A2044_04495 [Candidatus Firestonebacteria bacterium GWA2_43_8]